MARRERCDGHCSSKACGQAWTIPLRYMKELTVSVPSST